MNTFTKFLRCSIALVSLCLFQTAFAGAQRVIVTNGTNTPVPVSVQGQVPVTVQGQLPVNVQNQVATRNVNEPAQQPYDKSTTVTIPDLQRGTSAAFDVPAGKRLVIESVAVTAFLPTGQKLIYAGFSTKTTDSATPVNHGLNIVAHGNDAVDHDIFNASQLTRGYSEAGTGSVTVSVQRDNQNSNSNFVTVTVTGYLVDLPTS